jgi:hypothetical protein
MPMLRSVSAKDDRYNRSEKGRARWRSYAARRRAQEIEHEDAILDQVAARLASDPSWVPTREQAAVIDAMFERSIRRDEAREKTKLGVRAPTTFGDTPSGSKKSGGPSRSG